MMRLNFLKTKSSKPISCKYKKTCMICGKKFTINVSPDGKILTDCFHSYMNLSSFNGWFYKLNAKKLKDDYKYMENECFFDDNDREFKNNFYKIVGFSHISREIYYFIWKLFNNEKIEYWECVTCNNKTNNKWGINKEKKKNNQRLVKFKTGS